MSARSVEIADAAISATDVSHATDRAAEIFASYFGAKSAHDAGRFMEHFSRRQTTYADATLGWNLPTWEAQADVANAYMPNWGDGVSYATRILGDEHSAVLFVVASPEILGSDIRGISGVDLDEDGKIIRFIDYWDGRHFGAEALTQIRVSPDGFPRTFGEEAVAPQAGPRMRRVVEDLGGALAASDAERAAELFATDAVLEDMTLRTQVRGRPAIERYLGRAVGALPYAAGASVGHVMGNDLGGGYEWRNDRDEAARGIVALALDPSGLIDSLTTTWDGTLVGDDRLSSLARLALEL